MSDQISAAIVHRTGFGVASWPQHNIVEPDLQAPVNEVFEFADRLQPDWNTLDLGQSVGWAKSKLSEQFPELTETALDATAWALSYGWK